MNKSKNQKRQKSGNLGGDLSFQWRKQKSYKKKIGHSRQLTG